MSPTSSEIKKPSNQEGLFKIKYAYSLINRETKSPSFNFIRTV